MSRNDFREAILAATLPHVAFDGWNEVALKAGAVDAAYPEIDAARAFPGGPLDAILLHSSLADDQMAVALEAAEPSVERTRDKIAALIRLRLEATASDREAVRLGFGLLARPCNAGVGLKALAKTADAIWCAAGDRSTDFNWYTKRALVSAVYVATVAYWLSDKSEGFQDTWTFLNRRIDTVLKVPMQAKGMLGKFNTYMPRPKRIAAELRRRRTARS
jgi:ubiquinone biosynthesis protein COQ9